MKTLFHDLPTVAVNSTISSTNWLNSLSHKPKEVIINQMREAITKKAITVPKKQAKRSAALIGLILDMDTQQTFKDVLLDCAIDAINNL